MLKEKKQILDKSQIEQKIRRMAYEIYEQNHELKQIVLVGVAENGLKISSMLKKEIESISKISVHVAKLSVEKDAPVQPQVQFSDFPEIEQFTMVLVDDVMNSGRTMIYALDPFLKMGAKKIQTAVLVNRSHKRFPISVDYKGLELATTIQEHIQVNLTDSDFSAYLY
ncbi:phosphoribosyltransferase family protein [Roseivirga seohaensis]|uniref:phosphoribosyltransferase family protein n=1 Tax=Roseivirga seohaensis TaxID=1914963 RepID=UPI003BAA9BE9